MKILYFDINGTILNAADKAKPLLADGLLEKAVRAAGFERLVCVSSMVTVLHAYRQAGRTPDAHEFILGHCDGTFQDLDWFRATARMVEKPSSRVESIDEEADWYYMDDYAVEYLERAQRFDLLAEQLGKRILVTGPGSDGADVLDWLRRTENGARG